MANNKTFPPLKDAVYFRDLQEDEVIIDFCLSSSLELLLETLKRLRGNPEDYNKTFDCPQKSKLHYYISNVAMEITFHKQQLSSLNKKSHLANMITFRGGRGQGGKTTCVRRTIILERAIWEGELKEIYKQRIKERIHDLYFIKHNLDEIERRWREFNSVP